MVKVGHQNELPKGRQTKRHFFAECMGVSKHRGTAWYSKMDAENNGKPENPIKMDDLGVPLFLETPV